MYTEKQVDEIVEYYGKTEKDIPELMKFTKLLLDKNMQRYWLYGAYWWAVKKKLNELYSGDEWYLKSYFDENIYQKAFHGTEFRTLCAAAYFCEQQIAFTNCHAILENGEEITYTLFDEDADY